MRDEKPTNKGLQAARARTHEQKSEASKKAAQTRRRHQQEGLNVTSFEEAGRRGAQSRWGARSAGHKI